MWDQCKYILYQYYAGIYWFLFEWQKDFQGMIASLQSKEILSVPKTIVFVQTKTMACKVFASLHRSAVGREHINMYHASLKEYVRTEFAKSGSKLRCLVATVAFGMVSSYLCLY